MVVTSPPRYSGSFEQYGGERYLEEVGGATADGTERERARTRARERTRESQSGRDRYIEREGEREREREREREYLKEVAGATADGTERERKPGKERAREKGT